jgi:hypothetical protein
MLISFSCPAIQLLHGFVCGMSSFSQAVLDERPNGLSTVYHVWLSSPDMAEVVRPDMMTLHARPILDVHGHKF